MPSTLTFARVSDTRTRRQKFTSGYADRVHSPVVVSKVFRTLVEQYPDYAARKGLPGIDFGGANPVDTLVGTGLSGALIVPQLARSLKRAGCDVGYLLVRKERDGTHSSYQVEGTIGRRWMFVDDLIASGRTLKRCITAIANETRFDWTPSPELAAVFLYGTTRAGAGQGTGSLTHASQHWNEGSSDSRGLDTGAGWDYSLGRKSLGEYDAFDRARPRTRSISGKELAA